MRLNNLAVFYKPQGRTGQAGELYKRALRIFEKALGPKHPHTRGCSDKLATLSGTADI